MVRKTLVPTDFRDWLAILSFIGFLGIFFEFFLENPFLSERMTPIFLLIGGAGILISGKVFKFNELVNFNDGLQRTEITVIFSLILGFASMIMGILMFLDVTIPERVLGTVGIIAAGPALLILVDYFKKNS